MLINSLFRWNKLMELIFWFFFCTYVTFMVCLYFMFDSVEAMDRVRNIQMFPTWIATGAYPVPSTLYCTFPTCNELRPMCIWLSRVKLKELITVIFQDLWGCTWKTVASSIGSLPVRTPTTLAPPRASRRFYGTFTVKHEVKKCKQQTEYKFLPLNML